MTRTIRNARLIGTAVAAIAMSFSLSACFDGDDDDDTIFTPVPPTGGGGGATPPPPPPSSLSAASCLQQLVGPGTTVANLAIPDVLNINPNAAAGFPNGRLPADPVIDVILAVLLLDIDDSGQSPLTFANLPLNPDGNDVPLPAGFPFLAGPQGSPPISATTGTNFNFRTQPASDYARVDRMGFPAISTALIPSASKIPYNDANPAIDASGQFADEITMSLQTIVEALQDDLTGLGLDTCADE